MQPFCTTSSAYIKACHSSVWETDTAPCSAFVYSSRLSSFILTRPEDIWRDIRMYLQQVVEWKTSIFITEIKSYALCFTCIVMACVKGCSFSKKSISITVCPDWEVNAIGQCLIIYKSTYPNALSRTACTSFYVPMVPGTLFFPFYPIFKN